jgi:hypothetical protein
MTLEEQRIYNTWLLTNRRQQGKPGRPRKKFDNMDESTVVCIEKISKTLKRLDINLDQFFVAPFQLWPDTTYMPLDFYTKHKAIITWKKIFAKQ